METFHNVSTAPSSAVEKNVKLTQLRAKYEDIENHFQSQRKKIDAMNSKVVELNMQLRDEREKNYQLASKIRGLEIQISANQGQIDEIAMLKKQNRDQERRLTEILKTPIFADSKDRTEQAAQFKQMQAELVHIRVDNESVRGQNQKLEVELDREKQKFKMNQEKISELKVTLTEKEETLKELNK